VGATLQSGGSIGIWQKYFGTGLTMYGMDINPYCKVGVDTQSHALVMTTLVQQVYRGQPARSSRGLLRPCIPQITAAVCKPGVKVDFPS
jgi:hypothetical protein